ncbi:MAG TPA: LysR family transcriptional regulator [Stellaceae bacterium]|nr:LysR family transcriptional regulator [Stellaceae bacterium]
MLDLRNLETFVRVARLGGFGAAALKLNTTQPAISARIALLERDLGTRLFERKPRAIALTAKGLELLDYAERMLSLRADILRAVGDPASLKGVLRLGVPETIVHTWLADLAERINAIYPSVALDIEVDAVDDLHAALVSDNLDIAVLFGPVIDPRLKSAPLCSYPLMWFASTKLDLPQPRPSLADVARWPIITFRRQSAPYLALRRHLAKSGLPDARLFGSSSIAAIVRMALDGVGPCVLPKVVVERELRAGTLRLLDIPHELPPITFDVSYMPKPDSYLAAAVAELTLAAASDYGEGE